MITTVSPDASIRAWHFTDGDRLRDGRQVQVGDVIVHDGPLVICESGLHASRRAIDALQYAPGSTVWIVDCWGNVIEQVGKLVCTYRRHVVGVEGVALLHSFARWAALQVAHLWQAPEAVVQYLETGDESMRAAAGDAAWDAAGDASWDAAGDAAWSAARAAARAAAWDAAGDDAWSAARDAARAAARDAARAAAWDAAGAAAWSAARAAALDAQNTELERLIHEALGVETGE